MVAPQEEVLRWRPAQLLQLRAESAMAVRAREVVTTDSFSQVAEPCLSSRDSCSASPTKALRGPPGPQGTTSPSTTHRVHHGERPGSSCALEKKNLLQPLACLLQPLSQPLFQPLSQTLLRPLFQTLFQPLFQPLCQPLAGGLSQPLARLRRGPALLQTLDRKPTLLGPVTKATLVGPVT